MEEITEIIAEIVAEIIVKIVFEIISVIHIIPPSIIYSEHKNNGPNQHKYHIYEESGFSKDPGSVTVFNIKGSKNKAYNRKNHGKKAHESYARTGSSSTKK